jgi:hypothetical protein
MERRSGISRKVRIWRRSSRGSEENADRRRGGVVDIEVNADILCPSLCLF